MRRVFRDYTVMLVAHNLNMTNYTELLSCCDFGRLETTDDDKGFIEKMKSIKPDLVVACRNLSLFSGPQLLSAARRDKSLQDTPFIIVGEKADLRPGGLAEQVEKEKWAKFVGKVPLTSDYLIEAIENLLDPLIDPKKEEAYGLLDEAGKLAETGQPEAAVEKYNQAFQLYDKNEASQYRYADLLLRLGRDEEAETAYLKVLSDNNNALRAYFGLAELYEHRRDYEMAVDILKQALAVGHVIKKSNQMVSRINFYLGEFELRLARLTDAATSFNQAIDHNPKDAKLRSDIGDAYADKEYFAESEPHYQSALELDPNQAHVFNRLGIAYRRQQKYQKALDLYHTAQNYVSEDEHLMFNMARVHYEMDQLVEACALLDKAVEIAPEFKAARKFLAKIKSRRRVVDLSDD